MAFISSILAAAVLAAATPSAHSREAHPVLRLGSRPQEFIFAKITVSDLQRSIDFYNRVVGLRPTNPADAAAAQASSADFVEISLNQTGSPRDAALVLIRRKGDVPNRETARRTWLGFKVPDVAAAIGRIKAEGYEIRNEATEHDGARFGIAYDPDGYTVEFLETESAE